MFKHAPFNALLIMAWLFASPALAATAIDDVQRQIDAFRHSPEYAFAPATTAKAQAYLGAAMLAEDKKQQEQVAQGIEKAQAMLNEAKQTAERFQQQYSELIGLKRAAEQTMSAITNFDPLQEPNPKQLLHEASQRLEQSVRFYEAGDMNQATLSSTQTADMYRQVLDAALPALVDTVGGVLSKAAADNAKKYAPQSYTSAKEHLAEIEQYIDGLRQHPPAQPLYALQYAERALEIARQVKIWRKDMGSHEGIALKARADRIKLARSMGIPIDENNPNTDISTDTLLEKVSALKAELAQEKSDRKAERIALQQQCTDKLAATTAQLRAEHQNQQKQHISGIKEAFRAKLERETFETKRQKQVKALFKSGEVDIFVNLDGSLLIRLVKLRFASGSSKIDPDSYKLLGKLKKALEIYGERKIRLEGHTDSQGDVKLNQKISLKRAEAVRDFLIAANLDGSRIKALGYGEVRPIASNDFKKGRAMNRRIDVIIEAAHE